MARRIYAKKINIMIDQETDDGIVRIVTTTPTSTLYSDVTRDLLARGLRDYENERAAAAKSTARKKG